MSHSTTYDFGMIGLGVMGRNFLLNVADQGFSALGLDRDAAKAASLDTQLTGQHTRGVTSATEFVKLLKTPRTIMLLVPAGPIVDDVIAELVPLLAPGDLVIDGGNSHFPDTARRAQLLQAQGLRFLGVGVSGGAEGARRGPSIMPGGDPEAWRQVAPIFEAVAAQAAGQPCVAYMGAGAAGHYVKMVHNGIEYGLMQLIAEAYDLLHRVGGFNHADIARQFETWNTGRLQSFLVEITASILRQPDDLAPGQPLVEAILDKAKQKGTGKWTSQHALDLGIPIPTIDAAVTMRGISALYTQRQQLAARWPAPPTPVASDPAQLAQQVEQALYFAFVCIYAQGLHLLAEASRELKFATDLATVARIWRGGCIIRAALLEDIHQAYAAQPDLDNLLHDPALQTHLAAAYPGANQLLQQALQAGIPTLALASAVHYFDAMRAARLPLNLVQAQRDHFGQHTYERLDREGVFSTRWQQ